MNAKAKYMLVLGALISVSTSVLADEAIGIQAFGDSTMTSLKPVEKKPGECLSFEASFSEPLDKNPSAVMDIEQHFINLANAVLEVTKSPTDEKKYRMVLAKTDKGCPELLDDSIVTISTYSGKDADNERQTLPQAVTFKAEKNTLKKE